MKGVFTENRERRGYSVVDVVAAGMVLGSLVLWGGTRFWGDAVGEVAVEMHEHQVGPQGGVVVAFADQSRHAEVLIESDGEVLVFLMGRDESEVVDVEAQELTVELRDARGVKQACSLNAAPQAGDAVGRTSRFTGIADLETLEKPIRFTVQGLRIAGKRYRWGGVWAAETHEVRMPSAVSARQAEELYLTPGGLYTDQDIADNGNQTAAQKFVNFQAKHDFRPQPGDALCPITRTKANPQCSWVIGGETYLFCCPPCVDEFLKLAKSDPAQILPAAEYVQP